MLLFNRDRVAGLISEIRKALGRLESLRVLNKEEFLRDTHKVSSAKYNLIVAIECAIDICTKCNITKWFWSAGKLCGYIQGLGRTRGV